MKGLKEKILAQTTEWDIFLHYMRLMGYEDYQLKKNVRSPFRQEKNPSFGIYRSNGNYYFKDFAGEGGDVWKFAKLYYEIYCNKVTSFYELLVNVASEMGVNTAMRGIKMYKRAPVIILPEVRKIFENLREVSMHLEPVFGKETFPTLAQKSYLQGYGINKFDGFNISYHDSIVRTIDDTGKEVNKKSFINSPYNPVFTFEAESFFDSSKAFRIYQPLVSKTSDDYKHYGNVKSHHVYNPEKRTDAFPPEEINAVSRILVLLGGYKDAYLFNELTPFFSAATGGEGWALHPSFVDWMKKCDFLPVIFYDRDAAGIAAAKKISDEYGIPSMTVDEWGMSLTPQDKDFADLARNIQAMQNHVANINPQCKVTFYQEQLTPFIKNLVANHNWNQWNLNYQTRKL